MKIWEIKMIKWEIDLLKTTIKKLDAKGINNDITVNTTGLTT